MGVPMSLATHSIFINYRRADSGYAVGRLYEFLCKAFGRDAVFCDFDSIPKGADFPDSIRTVLGGCRVVLPVIGKDWLRIFQERSHDPGLDWVREELEIVLQRRDVESDSELLIYPLFLHDASPPTAAELPDSLGRLPGLNGDPIRIDPDFHADVDRVLRTIGEHLGVAPQPEALAGGVRLSPPHDLETIRWTEELRTYGEGFVGREDELEALDRAWAGGRVRVFSLWADGGEGKTRLVVKWLTRVRDDGWRGAGPVLVHSFYSQGCDERRNASADFFFTQALRHFGYDGPPIADATERGRKLASLVAEQNGLLVLDGLEPLQHARSFDEGRLKDAALRALVLSLANAPRGLCLITSRQPVVELHDRIGAAVVQQELNRLDPIVGAALLRQLDVRGTEPELREAVEEYHGHAYSLMLLGTYLGETLDHDIRRRGEIPLLDEDDPASRLPGHSRRMFAAYVAHLGEQSPEVAVLRLLGFIDRAAEMELIDVLRKGDADEVREIIAPLVDLSTKQWLRVLNRLIDLRLIHFHDRAPAVGRQQGATATQFRHDVPKDEESRNSAALGPAYVDSHALLREYFAEELRTRFAAAWRAGHRRLYEHLTATTEHRPDTLDGLQPLYQAVAHGCLAGLHQKACVDVYRDRILRGTGSDGNYSTFKLGAIGADLGAVACFFDTPWTVVSPNLTPAAQAWLLNEAAFRLRAMGRLTEAVEPMRVGLDMRIDQEVWGNAARIASNLSELELTRGAVSAAVTAGQQSVTYADRSEEWSMRMITRTAHADALHQAGRIEEARRLLEDAEAIQAERQPEHLRLYSLGGFRYGDLLLSAAERAAWRAVLCLTAWATPRAGASAAQSAASRCVQPGHESARGALPTRLNDEDTAAVETCTDVIERATQTLDWMVEDPNAPLLTIALDHLTLARAALYRALLDACDLAQLQSAIQDPECEIQNHLAAAVTGLRAAGQMDYLPRGLLPRSWLRFLLGDMSGSREDLDEAWDIADRGPMPLFQADILLNRVRLFGRVECEEGSEKAKTAYPWGSIQQDLAEARRLIQEHGYHRRDEELTDAEQAILSVQNS